MLSLNDIHLTVAKNTPLERVIFQGLNLSVDVGEFTIVVGGNGAGKSTMFNMIAGAVAPDSGQIIIDGTDVTFSSQTKRAEWVSMVMQDPRMGTIENMTILENMSFALKRGRKRGWNFFSNKSRRNFFQEKLSLLSMGLENRLDMLVSGLSGGERQALSLIMSILADSKILLFDEITAALDPKISEKVMELANDLVRKDQYTCIMITHNMLHALHYGDRVMLLHDGIFGRIVDKKEKEFSTVAQLMTEIGI